MNNYFGDRVVNLKDLVTVLLSKIVIVIISAVLLGTIGFGYAFVKGNRMSSPQSMDEFIVESRKALTQAEAETVDSVYQQYISYTEYKDSLQKFCNTYLLMNDDLSSYIQEVVMYRLSSNVFGANTVFASLSLTPEKYKEIENILPDEDALATIYNRVWISSEYDKNLTMLNGDESDQVPYEYTLTVNIIAKDRDQCDRICSITEDAIYAQLNAFKGTDPDASIDYIGKNYTEDLSRWIIERENYAISQLNSVETALKNFKNNQVSNLSSKQKAYYDLLVADYYDQAVESAKPSAKKDLLIGTLGGVVIACGCIILWYLFSPTIKTKDEVISRYKIPVLNTISCTGNNDSVINKLIRRLKGVNDLDAESSVNLVASDIGILLNKIGAESIYIVESSGTEKEHELVGMLERAIKNEKETINVYSGEPMSSSDELKKMAYSDNVVLIAELKKVAINKLDAYYELFQRYDSNILGSIVIEKV